MRTLRVGLAQIDTTVGDLAGNAAKIIDWIGRARDLGVDLVAFPELAVTGYPPEDLLLRRSFVEDNLAALDTDRAGDDGHRRPSSASSTCGRRTSTTRRPCSPTAVIAARYHKQFLPNYGVFDEDALLPARQRRRRYSSSPASMSA